VSWRHLPELLRARASAWRYVRRQQRAEPAGAGVHTGWSEFVEDAIEWLWDAFDSTPERLTPAQSAVLHVWAAHDLIGSAGLLGFVVSMGDRAPEVARGYRTLDLPDCSTAVEATLALFPGTGAGDPTARLAAHDSWSEEGPEKAALSRLEAIVWSHDAHVVAAAARFIREHPDDFPVRP
jgi:hypothetical protein